MQAPVGAGVTPERFLGIMNAYQGTAAIKAAIELELFTAIDAEGTPALAIAERCRASERGIRILCDFLTVMGFLKKTDDRYTAAPDAAAFLDRRSPAYIGDAIRFMLSPKLVEGFWNLTETVRQGQPNLPAEGVLAPEHPVWVDFARTMAPIAAMAAPFLPRMLRLPDARSIRILDVAAGHGQYGINFASAYPNARVVALDWPNVLTVAREHAEAAGVAERYETLPGSAFEVDFGTGYDLVLVTGFLHHFDFPACASLIAKAFNALAPGGQLAVLDHVVDADGVTPPQAAAFGLTMLASTPAGNVYSAGELQEMARSAGFSHWALQRLPAGPQSLFVAHK